MADAFSLGEERTRRASAGALGKVAGGYETRKPAAPRRLRRPQMLRFDDLSIGLAQLVRAYRDMRIGGSNG
jgi:hypothetical protein